MRYPIIFESDSATANSCWNERKYKNIMVIWYTVCLYVIFSQAPPLNLKSLFATAIWCHQNKNLLLLCLPLLFFFTNNPSSVHRNSLPQCFSSYYRVQNTCAFAANYYRLAIHLQLWLFSPHFEWVGWVVSLITDNVEQFTWLWWAHSAM